VPLSALKLLSLVIPARNEQEALASTLKGLSTVLSNADIPFEILVIDDGSTDNSFDYLKKLSQSIPQLHPLQNPGPHGFGMAVRYGLERFSGDAVVVYMADASDSPEDVVQYWQLLNQGYHCVFGSRFIRGGKTVDYPWFKYILNRITNKMVQWMFGIRLNDTTNAFKAYSREAIEGCHPFLSPHFNLTVELPLKCIIRGFSWTTCPISWHNRKTGTAKFQIKEMGSRYIFIILYALLEKFFSRGDFKKDATNPD